MTQGFSIEFLVYINIVLVLSPKGRIMGIGLPETIYFIIPFRNFIYDVESIKILRSILLRFFVGKNIRTM